MMRKRKKPDEEKEKNLTRTRKRSDEENKKTDEENEKTWQGIEKNLMRKRKHTCQRDMWELFFPQQLLAHDFEARTPGSWLSVRYGTDEGWFWHYDQHGVDNDIMACMSSKWGGSWLSVMENQEDEYDHRSDNDMMENYSKVRRPVGCPEKLFL